MGPAVMEVSDEEAPEEPPTELPVPEPEPREPARVVVVPDVNPSTIECPSVPGESERMRMDRAMAKVLQMLRKAGAVVPENLRLEHRCRDMQHAGCFVYQFGTRQLHISTRSVDAERLRVLVRNGGGFDNFMAFALRQGKAESARL